jgi:hypothetical protein
MMASITFAAIPKAVLRLKSTLSLWVKEHYLMTLLVEEIYSTTDKMTEE